MWLLIFIICNRRASFSEINLFFQILQVHWVTDSSSWIILFGPYSGSIHAHLKDWWCRSLFGTVLSHQGRYSINLSPEIWNVSLILLDNSVMLVNWVHNRLKLFKFHQVISFIHGLILGQIFLLFFQFLISLEMDFLLNKVLLGWKLFDSGIKCLISLSYSLLVHFLFVT